MELGIDIAYEPDYEIEDTMFSEPFVVLRPVSIGRPNWWSNRKKVEALINAFKMDLMVSEACIHAGISNDQYRNFCHVHPHFATVKARCKRLIEILAKQNLLADVGSRNPAAMRVRQWILERKQPELYGREMPAMSMPEGTAAKITAEAFLDDEGNMIVSRKTSELLNKRYGDGEDQAE